MFAIRARFIALLACCSCSPPILTPEIKPPNLEDASAPSCKDAWKQTELSLMGWDHQHRSALGRLQRQGVIAVHYEVNYSSSGCSIDLELLPNCHARGVYEYASQPVTDHKIIHNASELYAELPLGAAKIGAQLTGKRAFRADFMQTGIAALPMEARYHAMDLDGSDCERATHVIGRIYLGGFAWAYGGSSALDASGSLFSARAGGKATAEIGQVHTEGDAKSCERAQGSAQVVDSCRMPLHVGLLPVLGRTDICSDLHSCEQRCEGGDADSCNRVGVLSTSDSNRAMKYFERACNGRSEWGCFNYAGFLRDGAIVPRNSAYALSIFELGCSRGLGPACAAAGNMYQMGNGIPADIEKAIGSYDSGCRLGEMPACQNELPLLERQCGNSNLRACGLMASLYEGGLGVAIDLRRALSLYEGACERGEAWSCTAVGRLLESGAAGAPDPQRAGQFYERACDAKLGDACLFLGVLHERGTGVSQNAARAVELFEKSCNAGYQLGCVYLGDMFRSGHGTTLNLEQAAKLFYRACETDEAAGCLNLGEILEQEGEDAEDAAQALNMYRKACRLGHRKGCEAADRLAR